MSNSNVGLCLHKGARGETTIEGRDACLTCLATALCMSRSLNKHGHDGPPCAR